MTIGAHLAEFEGLPVLDYSPAEGVPSQSASAFRVALDWEAHDEGKSFLELFAEFVADPAAAEVQALLIGDWGGAGEGNDSTPVVEALASARDRLPKLRALFLGEMTMEESEISWITQSDVSPLFEAFPSLETLCLRGATACGSADPDTSASANWLSKPEECPPPWFAKWPPPNCRDYSTSNSGSVTTGTVTTSAPMTSVD